MDPAVLGRDVCLHILGLLNAPSLLALGTCSREWCELAADEALWQALCRRDQPSLSAQHALALGAGATWRIAYARTHCLQALRRVRWQPEALPGGRRPREREGHTACAWGRRSMLLHGGFGGGILRDLHILTPAGPPAAPFSNGAAAGGSSSDSDGAGASGGASGSPASPTYRWLQPQVAGTPPLPRYGHSLSRCRAADGSDIAIIFGGLLAGGYQAPLDTIAVLRRKPPPAAPADEAAGPATCDAEWEAGQELGEANTSLGRRLLEGAGGGGAAPFGQLAWHPMQLVGEDFWEQEEDWMGSDGADGSEDDADSFDNWMDAEDEDGSANDDEGMHDAAAEGEPSPEGSPPSDSPAAMAAAAAEVAAAILAAEAAAAPAAHRPARDANGELDDGVQPDPLSQRPRLGDGPSCGPDCQGQGQAEEDWGAAEWEWCYPAVQGEAPGSRGYHSAAVSQDGSKVYVFGGISAGGACNTLAVLDIATWSWSRPLTTGEPPSPRCGHCSVVYGGKLWVVGGGSGRDLLRSGRDLGDVHTLDLATMEWAALTLPPGPACAGKCHSACLVGSRLLLFGGSMPTCSELAWLDLEACRWGAPAPVLGREPAPRMSAAAVLAGEEVLVFGGFTFSAREVGDLHRLRLVVDKDEEAREAAAAGVARAAASRAMRRWRSLWV